MFSAFGGSAIYPETKSQAEKSRPGAHNPGDLEHYQGLPPFSIFRVIMFFKGLLATP